MDLLLLDALLSAAPHYSTHECVRAPGLAPLQPAVEESADGWMVACALPGLGAKDVRVETSTDADGTPHLWLTATKRGSAELWCVPPHLRAACLPRRGAQHGAARGARRGRALAC